MDPINTISLLDEFKENPKLVEAVTQLLETMKRVEFWAGAMAMREQCLKLADSSGQQMAIYEILIEELYQNSLKKT